MAAVDVELYVTGDSDFSESLDGAVPLGLSLLGNSAFGASARASLPQGLVLAGGSAYTATPSLDGTDGIFFNGEGFFTAVALLRKAFVSGPTPGVTPPNPFPGLQVGRQPARRTSRSTITPNPPRNRRSPEEPER